MTLDTKAQAMAHGEALLEAPIAELIYRVAASIAEAQLKLDQVGVRVASLLSETEVPFTKADGKTVVKKSLLELGFLPPFYAFTKTEIEVKMTLNLKVEESTTIKGNVNAGQSGEGLNAAKRVVPFGVSISADYHRKYEFDMQGTSSVKATLVSLPAPSVFVDTIKEHARGLGAARELDDEGGDAPDDPADDPTDDPADDPTGDEPDPVDPDDPDGPGTTDPDPDGDS